MRSFAYALAQMGRPVPSEDRLATRIGPPLRAIFADLLETDDTAVIETAVRHYRDRFASEGLFEHALYPGIAALLARLGQGGHRLYVATSKPQVYAGRILTYSGLDDCFTAVYGCELDGTRAAKGELIAYLLERERLDPAGCIMIGDREHDMAGGRANGVAGIGVLWGFGSAEELWAAGATAVCEDIAQLETAVGWSG